jgi:peptidyl-prolyl cis-trans isomerase D
MGNYLQSLEYERLAAKYTALLGNSIYYPKWFLEKQNGDNSLIANVSYVVAPYNSISDSTIKITDSEIEGYIKDHKKDFEQKEETRSVSYVTFSAAPSAVDSAAVRNSLLALKDSFATTPDYEKFLIREGSLAPFYASNISRNDIKNPNKDSILSAPAGAVYGPYLDGSGYTFSKILDVKQWPDTVKVRHILVTTHQQNQTGQLVRTREDSTAKKLIDSIQEALTGGAPFDTLLQKYSEDPGSKDKGGVYENVPTGQMVASFNDFIFGNPAGSKGVVKTEYGYHYIEILSHQGSSPAYKIAYLSKPIVSSPETENTASNAATVFAGDSRDAKTFDTNFEKNLKGKGGVKLVANDIRPNDYSIMGLGSSREFVKAVFAADRGEVIQPVRVGENYVVAVVTDVSEAGLQSVAKARSGIEPILRNKKKAAQLKQKIGKVATLEAASSALGQPVQKVDSLHFNGNQNPALGYEFKVVGAAFNPANKGKVVSEVLEGQTGVFVLRVDNIGTIPVQMADIEEQRKMLQMQARQGSQYGSPVLEALKKSATITDNRAKFF